MLCFKIIWSVLIFAEALESNFKEADLDGWCQQEGRIIFILLFLFYISIRSSFVDLFYPC